MTQPTPEAARCYRHPDRETFIKCQRCARPICGDCMISAAVGFQCPDCVRAGAKQTRQNQLPFGGERTDNPAVTSMVLIGINIAVWVAILLTGGAYSHLTDQLSLTVSGTCYTADMNSYYPRIDSASSCAAIGDTWWAPGVTNGAWWQVITSGFAHVELLHIGFNMLALWFLGPPLERVLGRARFLAVYLLSLLAGSAVVLWFSGAQTSTLGASGAIFGLLGALLVLTYKTRGDVRNVLIWLGINVVYTFLGPGVSWQGHLGGLLGGVVVSAIVMFAPRQNRGLVQLLGIAAVAVCIGVAITARVVLG